MRGPAIGGRSRSSRPGFGARENRGGLAYWLWVNGKLIVFEGSLKRGPNRTDSYVDTVELAPHLKPGKNTIAILSWYFGREGMSHLSSGMPGLYVDSDRRPGER